MNNAANEQSHKFCGTKCIHTLLDINFTSKHVCMPLRADLSVKACNIFVSMQVTGVNSRKQD